MENVSQFNSHNHDEHSTLIENKQNNLDDQLFEPNTVVRLDLEMFKKLATLSLSGLGGAYLVIPSKVGSIGIVWFIIFLAIVFKVMYFTCMILLKLSTVTKIYNYTALMTYFMGKTWGVISFVVLLFGCIGVSVLYLLISKFYN